jgi:hypothetical protein
MSRRSESDQSAVGDVIANVNADFRGRDYVIGALQDQGRNIYCSKVRAVVAKCHIPAGGMAVS